MSASLSSTGTSDWVHAYVQCMYRLDVDVPDTVSAITYTVETTGETTGQAKTLKKPNDVDTNWSWTDESAAFVVEGNAYYRLNISAYTGSGSVVLSLREVRVPS